MFSTKVNLQLAGVYVYRSPKQISIPNLQRELVITLIAKKHGVCGLVVYPHGFVRVELFQLLTNLKSTLCFEKRIPAEDLEAKIFGCSSGQTNALYATQTWLRDQKMEISAVDTGRDVSRSLLVDCSTGKIGVKFADIHPTHESFLKLDSPSQRAHRKETTLTNQTAILVTDQRPLGFLAKRALEQNPHWKAERISSKDFIKRSKKSHATPTAAVICFEDISEEKNLAPALIANRKKNPNTAYFWAADSGHSLPLPLQRLSLPTSTAPEAFFKELTEALEAPQIETSTVLILPIKPKRKGSK